jgi:hypothetical protein
MKTLRFAGLAVAALLAMAPAAAQAECVTKGAVATAGSADSAKWYALETMVQAVSWGLWPGFLANNKVEGYNVINEKYSCKPDGGQVTCRGRATFCKK